MGNCKYFDICSLAAEPTTGDAYCSLHDPRRTKNHQSFQQQLLKQLRAQKTDFRHVVFPAGVGFRQPDDRFAGLINLKDAVLDTVDLSGATLPNGLLISTAKITSINLANTTILGPVEINLQDELDSFSIEHATLGSSLTLDAKACKRLLLSESKVKDKTAISMQLSITEAYFVRATLEGGIDFLCSGVGPLELGNVTISGSSRFRIKTSAASINARRSDLMGDVSIETTSINKLDLREATITTTLTVTGKITTVDLNGTTVGTGLCFQNCGIAGDELSFEQVTFGEAAQLSLRDSTIEGDLRISGTRTNPATLDVNGCTVKDSVEVRAELGKPPIKVLARTKRPDFRGTISFENASLAECRLLGNPFARMDLRNIEWNQRQHRAVIYDEIVLQLSAPIRKTLKEAYQVLKERYREIGDHVTSGDFHYGEMEMTRRQFGFLRRNLGLIAWYRAVSGYGMEPGRAALFLLYLLLLSIALFALGLHGEATDNFLQSIELTLQAGSFQPLTAIQAAASGLSTYERFIFFITRLILPLQAGLLALAIRTRLKR